MQSAVVSTHAGGRLLAELRAALSAADRALICAAFVSDAGVHLLREPLRRLGPRARLLTTTAFGSTSASALNTAHGDGVQVGVLNPPAGTYHPKLYLAAAGGQVSALVGSANLTAGLACNIEAAALLRGTLRDGAIADAWRLGEALWRDPRTVPWTPVPAAEPDRFTPELEALVRAEVARDPVFYTLGGAPMANRVTAVTALGVQVATAATARKGTPPQLVPAWMIQLAYDYLVEHGQLSNTYLLSSEGLDVKRSSFVCALLARLPGVARGAGRAIALEYRASRAYDFAAAYGPERAAADREGD